MKWRWGKKAKKITAYFLAHDICASNLQKEFFENPHTIVKQILKKWDGKHSSPIRIDHTSKITKNNKLYLIANPISF